MKSVYIKAIILCSPWIFSKCNRVPDKDSPRERPNILIAMADDISFPHMGAYGTKWVSTPGFDRIASDGILFNNVYTPNAKSAPSRACFLTGRNSWQLEEACNHVSFFPQKFKSFIESLEEHGYFSGYTAKGWAPGVALDSAGNQRLLTGRPFNARKLTPPASGISKTDYAGNFEDFLNSKPDNQPFCFWYGSTEPHRPYEYRSGIRKGGKKLTDIDRVFGFWPDTDFVRTDLLDYAFEIEHFDSQLVKMIEMLEKRGELENTVIIVTSDNGMPFPRVKGQAYEYSNHMPLAIMWLKGIRNPGRKIYDFISFIDFAPTMLELAGIKLSDSGMQPVEGKSFTNLLYTSKKGYVDKNRNHVLIGKERHDVGRPDDAGYPIRGIIKDGYLLIRNYKPGRWPAGNPETGYLNCDASPTKTIILNLRRYYGSVKYWNLCFGLRVEDELYNISNDPDCLVNLADDAGYNNLKQRLKDQLFDELTEQNDPRVTGNGDIFDSYPYAQDDTRDFYNRFMKGEVSWKNTGWVDSSDYETGRF
jgi:N-sulfoglucosamine sulfohydrolase